MDVKRMHESLECLSSWFLESCHNGPSCFDPCVAGQIADMMKDLSMAMYYRSEQKIMEEMEEESKKGEGSYGYNNWHYASGRFAPTGRGHQVSGYPTVHGSVRYYEPSHYMMPKEEPMMNDSMGYSMEDGYRPSKYGIGYDEYRSAKKHYTESRDDASKKHMIDKIEETVMDSIDVMRELMHDATPELRKKMKEQISRLSEELGKV